MPETLVTIAYLAAGLLFIFSLGGLSAQESARRGNVFGMLGMLIAVVTCTVAMGVPMSALGRAAAPAFALMAFVLGGCYFVVLGGVVGATPGEQAVGLRSETMDQRPVDLRAVAARTLQCIFRDASFIGLAGKWIGRSITGHRWSASVNSRHHVEHRAA